MWAPVVNLKGLTGPTGPTGSSGTSFRISATLPYYDEKLSMVQTLSSSIHNSLNAGDYVLVAFDTSSNMTGETGSSFYQKQSDGTYRFVSILSLDILLTGPTGLAGPTGYETTATGSTGPTGYAGRSFTGYTGPRGISPTGPTGASALYTGPTGSVGYTGYTGDIVTGPTGPTGLTGPRGNNIYAIPYAPSSTTGPIQPQYPVTIGDFVIDFVEGTMYKYISL